MVVWVYLCIYTPISGHFERSTLRGCIFVADYGRVVASLQRLPCQKTKPKGLLGMFCAFTFEFIIAWDQ